MSVSTAPSITVAKKAELKVQNTCFHELATKNTPPIAIAVSIALSPQSPFSTTSQDAPNAIAVVTLIILAINANTPEIGEQINIANKIITPQTVLYWPYN